MHYHVFMGTASGAPMATSTFYEYSESVDNFLTLGRGIYGHTGAWQDIAARVRLDEAEEHDDNTPITFGGWPLCIQWVRCETPCWTASWN